MASTSLLQPDATATTMTAGSEILQPIETRSTTVVSISDTKHIEPFPATNSAMVVKPAVALSVAWQTDAFRFSNGVDTLGFCGSALASIQQSIVACNTDALCQCQQTVLKQIHAVSLTCLPEFTATQLQTLLIQIAQYDASCGAENAGISIGCQQSMIRLHNPKSECIQAAATYNSTLQCICEQPFLDGYIALHKSCKTENSNRTLSTSVFNLQNTCFSNANISLKLPRGMVAKSQTLTAANTNPKSTAFGNAVSASMKGSGGGIVIMNAYLVGLFVAVVFALLL
ncbi:hypothetical protein BJ741DRAFT_706838 [Chytriomyces cf. hyalinus JEL632]|nr:hypothetical protein BJ741DRAFT_706838 [Chytriomyces cf. hyalinus JEL632]